MTWAVPRLPASDVGRLRLVVLSVAAVVTVLKLELAARTFGTNDVASWEEFANGVRKFGPVGIYGHPFETSVYNHGPLAGWLLVTINWLVDHGIRTLPFLIRVPACVADFVSALLVFELVRLRRPAREAAIAAVLVACSPVLFVVSGFHGNTDPVFVMFTLLSVYLLVVSDRALAAGLAFGLGVSIKLVPVVLLPVLLVVLVRLGRRRFAAFVGGGAIVFSLLWLPVLISRWHAFEEQVLLYKGSGPRQWGLVQFLTWLHLPGVAAFLEGPGRAGVLLASGVIAATVVWRRPGAVAPAAGLSLVLFLLLSPAFGTQYLAWPLAAAYLIHTRAATGYNIAASILVVSVYDRWNHALPWNWYSEQANAGPFSSRELVFMVLTWLSLAVVAFVGLRLTFGFGTVGGRVGVESPADSARPPLRPERARVG